MNCASPAPTRARRRALALLAPLALTAGLTSGAPGMPANDHFSARISLGMANPATVTAHSNVGATLEAGEPQSLAAPPVNIPGGASVWWSWTAPSSGWFEIKTTGSTFDTVLYVFTGTVLASLVERDSNDDDTGTSTRSRLNFLASHGTVYQIAVHGLNGATGNVDLRIQSVSPNPPANDDFANAVNLGSGNKTGSGSNVNATLQGGEPDALDLGGASVWWKWTANSNSWFEVNTFGSTADTLLYVYSGSTLHSLTLLASNDDDAGDTIASRVNFSATNGTAYHFAVHGLVGDPGDIDIQVKSVATPPANDLFAARENLNLLGALPLSLDRTTTGATLEGHEPDPVDVGSASVWFEWTAPSSGWIQVDTFGTAAGGTPYDSVLYIFTGTDLASLALVDSNDDDHQATLDSRAVFFASSGVTYRIAVHVSVEEDDNPTGGTLTLHLAQAPAPPANDNFSARTSLGSMMPGFAAANNTGATLEGFEQLEQLSGGASLWWTWTAPFTELVGVSTFGSAVLDTVLWVYTGSDPANLVVVTQNDDAGTLLSPSYPHQSQVQFSAMAGQTYHFAVHGFAGATGPIQLNVFRINDQFADCSNLGSAPVVNLIADTTGATVQSGEPDPLGVGGNSIWFCWTATAGGPVAINTLGSAIDTVLYVFTGSSLGSLATVASSDDALGTPQSRVAFTAAPGVTYRIAVHGKLGQEGFFELQVSTLRPFQTWISEFPSLTGPNALPSANADGDPFTNLEELVFGLDPTLNSSGDDPDSANTPAFAATGSMIQLFFTVDPVAMNGGVGAPITIAGRWSYALVNWTTLVPISLGGNSYKVEAPIDANPRKYLGTLISDPNP